VRSHRGRKIALALKLRTVEVARRYGVERIVTNNDSLNAPMLSINRTLGYKATTGLVHPAPCVSPSSCDPCVIAVHTRAAVYQMRAHSKPWPATPRIRFDCDLCLATGGRSSHHFYARPPPASDGLASTP